MNDLASLLDNLGHPRILVIGDLMVDRYTTGPVARVSPEAPALVLQADQHEVRPGGAASVAALLRALGAEVSLTGVVGEDADGRILRRLLTEAGIDGSIVLTDPDRPTTLKERFLGRAAGRHVQQILRVDRESTQPLAPALAARLAETVTAHIGDYQAVLISDYDKGVCTPDLLVSVITAARTAGVPVLIDPARIHDYSRYRSADVLKPNRAQAELATGRRISSPEDALAAGRDLCERWDLKAALVTLDRDGMALIDAGGSDEWFSTHPHDVYDITGAGDVVLAVVGLCRAAELALPMAARLANVAAGLEVQRLGVATITRAELAAALRENRGARKEKRVSAERLSLLAECYRSEGKRIVFTNGCFDLLHAGHLAYLEEAARMGDVLVVAVNTDASVARLKGPQRPIVAEAERATLVAALACVHHVVLFDEDTPLTLLERVRPQVLVKGGTYDVDTVVGRELVEGYGGHVCVTGKFPGRSTTRLLQKLGATAADSAAFRGP